MGSLAGRLAKAAIGAASAATPGPVGRLAARWFLTPLRAGALTGQERALMTRARGHLKHGAPFAVRYPGGTVQAYRFRGAAGAATRGTVILVHGWSGRAAFMTGFVTPLTAKGFDVVCFDLPAHGRSDGRRTNGLVCAAALQAVAAEAGPVHALVGHSFGGLVIGIAVEGRPPMLSALEVSRIALIASPNGFCDMTARFGRHVGLGAGAQAEFERALAEIGGRPLDAFDGNRLLGAQRRPLLVVHSRDDRDVPFEQGAAFRALGDHVTLMPVDGLGHRQILYAPSTIRAVRDFIAAPDMRPAPEDSARRALQLGTGEVR